MSATMPALPQSAGDRWKLALAALGVVYGDIGTSPLYAIKECVNPPHGVGTAAVDVFGIVSLVFWSLGLVVGLKYLLFVLRMDNRGEGGVLALMALVAPRADRLSPRRTRRIAVWLGLFGAALLYGDGVITPAISVLSAVEGLGVATHSLDHLVLPITIVVLVALFFLQRYGTAGIGAIFGPITLLWFGAITVAALPAIGRHPEILGAVNPIHAVRFFAHHRLHGFLVLGSIVLCVTGAEALYADMGHFGRGAIRRAWIAVVMPALLASYFGQGALLLERPDAVGNPFYALVEGTPWLYPMVAIATAAAIVASQALIAGAFSLTRQAMQLGFVPRLTIVHTSGRTEGQIYIPEVNGLLAVSCVAIVLSFRTSSGLAAAYGIAVTLTMAITSLLFYMAARDLWRWSRTKALLLVALFLVVDGAFLGANLAKIVHGGWFPLVMAAGGLVVMTTWKHGRTLLAERFHAQSLPIEHFITELASGKTHRVQGTAVFMTSTRRGTPNVLLHHFKHNKSLHEQVLILTVVTDDVPEVRNKERVRFRDFGEGLFAVTAHYGFMETPDVNEILKLAARKGLTLRTGDVTYFLGRESFVASRPGQGLPGWQRRLFGFLSRNAKNPTDFFRLPPNRVVELGTQIEL